MPQAESIADKRASAGPERIRVVLFSEGLARYRVPVFAELARRPGIDLEVCYSQTPWLKNAEPKGFEAREVPFRVVSKKPMLLFQGEPWRVAGRRIDRPDVLVLGWNMRHLELAPATWRAHLHGTGVVYWGHGYSRHDSARKRFIRNRLARLADAIVLYYASRIDLLVSEGLDRRRLFAAPNAIDQAPIQQAREGWERDAQSLALFRQTRELHEGPVLLFVARLLPSRRLHLLIEALPAVAEVFPSVQAVIIGDGEDIEHQRARDLAIKCGVRVREPEDSAFPPGEGPRLRFVDAIYNEEQIAPWFLCADAMVFPSGLGLSVLHAFGYGLPVVAGDDPSWHYPEFIAVRDDHNARLFSSTDPADLARQLIRLLSDPRRLKMLGQNALEDVLQEYNVPRMVDGLEEAIRFAYRERRGNRRRQ